MLRAGIYIKSQSFCKNLPYIVQPLNNIFQHTCTVTSSKQTWSDWLKLDWYWQQEITTCYRNNQPGQPTLIWQHWHIQNSEILLTKWKLGRAVDAINFANELDETQLECKEWIYLRKVSRKFQLRRKVLQYCIDKIYIISYSTIFNLDISNLNRKISYS